MKPEHRDAAKNSSANDVASEGQATDRRASQAFAKKAMERIQSSSDPYRDMRWLLPRIGSVSFMASKTNATPRKEEVPNKEGPETRPTARCSTSRARPSRS